MRYLIILLFISYNASGAYFNPGELKLNIKTNLENIISLEIEASSIDLLGFKTKPSGGKNLLKWKSLELDWYNHFDSLFKIKNNSCKSLASDISLEQFDNRAYILGKRELKCQKSVDSSDIVNFLKDNYQGIKSISINFEKLNSK